MHNHQIEPYGVRFSEENATDDHRVKAFARTADVMKKLDEIRRGLELSADQLPLVVEMYGRALMGVVADATRLTPLRVPLPLRSEDRYGQPMKIAPGLSTKITTRPQCGPWRAEDISIHGDRSRWVVEDIIVGNCSQLMRRGSIPGAEFGPGGVCASLRLATAQIAQDFDLVVTYVGPEAEGEVFEATAVGLGFQL